MDDIDKELRPILANLITLRPSHSYRHKTAVIKLYDWLIQPEHSADEFYYVVGPLHDYVYASLKRGNPEFYTHFFVIDERYKHIAMLRTAAEALVARCPVLEGRWEQIAWHIFVPLSEKKFEKYGNISSELSNWIIQVVGNPDVCPNVDLRYQILLLYKTLVEINCVNYMRALESFMSLCCSIDIIREYECGTTKTKNILECMMLFKKEKHRENTFQCKWWFSVSCNEFLYKFGLTVAEKVTSHRTLRQQIHLHDTSHDYSMGIKTITEPRELLSLSRLIRYLSNLAHLEYLLYKDGGEYDLEKLLVSSCGLVNIMRGFTNALQDPMLLSTTTESIVDVLEAVLILVHHSHGGARWSSSHAVVNIDTLIQEFIYCIYDGGEDIQPIGLEIIRKYKSRICFVKSQITQEFLEDDKYTLYSFLYKTEFWN